MKLGDVFTALESLDAENMTLDPAEKGRYHITFDIRTVKSSGDGGESAVKEPVLSLKEWTKEERAAIICAGDADTALRRYQYHFSDGSRTESAVRRMWRKFYETHQLLKKGSKVCVMQQGNDYDGQTGVIFDFEDNYLVANVKFSHEEIVKFPVASLQAV